MQQLTDAINIYDYQGLIERIKAALPFTFKRARIIEVRYGKRSTAETGDAILDLKNKQYKTDIEEGEFQILSHRLPLANIAYAGTLAEIHAFLLGLSPRLLKRKPAPTKT